VKAAAWVLRRASAVIFRDRSAVTNLVGSGVALPTHRVLPDPALGAPPCDPRRSAEILQQEGIDLVGREVLAVALRNLSYMNAQEPYEAMLAEVVDRWNQRGPQRAVLFIPQCSYHVGDPGTDDRHMARCLARRVATKSQCFFIEGEHQSSEIECLYAEARVTLATRLHGCVFSVKMGTATLGLAYEDKVSGFFDQLGMPEACLPLDATAEEVFRQIEQLAQKADTLRPLLLEKVEGLRQELCGYVNTAVDLIAERQRQLSAAKENQP
jgi:polysaccharide pyruvyl transferase WcaK-like protein